MLGRAGQEIYLRRPDAYRLVGCTAAFEQVADLVRTQERPETAIGYITQARSCAPARPVRRCTVRRRCVMSGPESRRRWPVG